MTAKRSSKQAAEEAAEDSTQPAPALFAERMVGIVSHDLRNPLSVIATSAAVLARTSLEARQRANVERIERAALRAQRIVNDLLDFAVARIGDDIAVTRVPIALHRVVAETLDELRSTYPTRDIRHLREPAGSEDDIVVADPARLAQLIGKLVANAVAYGAAGGSVRVTSSVAPGEFRVSVHNDGEPIAAALQARLFEPVLHDATRGDAPAHGFGLGLGLYIARCIARAHRGDVTLASAPGRGTLFTLIVPRDEA